MNKTYGRILTAPTALAFAVLVTGLLSGCATLGDSGPAICHGSDGTMVPVNDDRCPEDVRKALGKDTGPPVSIDQSITNDLYNSQNGLVAGDQGYR